MDAEQVQKIVDTIQSFVNDILKKLNQMYRAFKAWLKSNPVLAELLRRERQTRKEGVRSLFRQEPALKVYRSQISYWPVRAVARSRC